MGDHMTNNDIMECMLLEKIASLEAEVLYLKSKPADVFSLLASVKYTILSPNTTELNNEIIQYVASKWDHLDATTKLIISREILYSPQWAELSLKIKNSFLLEN